MPGIICVPQFSFPEVRVPCFPLMAGDLDVASMSYKYFFSPCSEYCGPSHSPLILSILSFCLFPSFLLCVSPELRRPLSVAEIRKYEVSVSGKGKVYFIAKSYLLPQSIVFLSLSLLQNLCVMLVKLLKPTLLQ